MTHGTNGTPAWKDTSLPFAERAADLVSRLTLEEKIGQMLNASPAIPRLGIPAYDWWNECLHGVARAGVATVFPQAIGLAATWDTDLIHRMAVTISDEARAKHHDSLRRGETGTYRGLTFWSPNINIFRDPRWGRGQETYGEDPFLTGRIGVAFVKGLQGDDPKYLKVVATPKHYAVHSGPEADRHHFDAQVTRKDLRETYLPAFRDCVREGKAASVMGAYNRTLGEPCCASKLLLQDILRDEWGFDGYVVSDCGAICDIHAHHHLTNTPAESSALAVNNGCDLCCGDTYSHLAIAVEQGLITEAAIDRAVTRLFEARFRLGMFDPPELVPYAQIPIEVNDCAEHRELARRAARESIVLLKNDGGLLPLSKDVRTIAVIGPNADALDVLLGNYYGTPSTYVTALEGIRGAVSPASEVVYAKGCEVAGQSRQGFAEAIAAANKAEVVVMCLGLAPSVEGEEGDAANSEAQGDRIHIDLPGVQEELLKEVCALGKPVVLVLFGGSAVAVNWAAEHVPAILAVWYPGEEGGTAIADVLFGEYSPAGRLPVTFVKSLDQLPPFDDYNMAGRTYRYMKDEPLYPFGFGLSYTTFAYSNLRAGSHRVSADENLEITLSVMNTGDRAGDEVVQVYISDLQGKSSAPVRRLVAFQRISPSPGESKTVSFTLPPERLALVDDNGDLVFEPGRIRISVGGSQGDARSIALGAPANLIADVELIGERKALRY